MIRAVVLALLAGCAHYTSATVHAPDGAACYDACVDQDESMEPGELVACVAKCPTAVVRETRCSAGAELCVDAKR